MSPTTNSPSLDLSPSTPSHKALEVASPALSKKRQPSRSLSRNPALSRRDKCLLLNSDVTMIVEIFPSESTTKTHYLSSSGKFRWNHLTIITISLFSLTELVKNSTLTVPLPLWAHMTCWTRAATRYYL